MEIFNIKNALDCGIPIEYTAHCQKRMQERDISRADVRHCIYYGEIIEDYPLNDGNSSEKSLPSCLILGKDAAQERILHVVVGYNEKRMLIISACFPDASRWYDDYKTRRR